jgi:hypothetical protein
MIVQIMVGIWMAFWSMMIGGEITDLYLNFIFRPEEFSSAPRMQLQQFLLWPAMTLVFLFLFIIIRRLQPLQKWATLIAYLPLTFVFLWIVCRELLYSIHKYKK